MFDSRLRQHDRRPLGKVPVAAWLALSVALAAQIAWSSMTLRPAPTAADLTTAPTRRLALAVSLGDPLTAGKLMNLVLQAHDNQPGLSIPFARLDYTEVVRWLDRILELDPDGPYPLLAASRLYGEVQDPQRQRLMLAFVHEKFHADPSRRWPALAHAAHVARHGLKDMALARSFAASLRREATADTVPGWVKQMEILLLADMNETESARVLLGALLDSGQLRDPAEIRFLSARLTPANSTASAPPAAKK